LVIFKEINLYIFNSKVMKRFLLYVFTIVSPILVIMAIINYTIDPGYIYADKLYDDLARAADKGLNADINTNIDERLYKEKLVAFNKNRKIDFLILGNSRVMTISSDCFKGKQILNLGVGGVN